MKTLTMALLLLCCAASGQRRTVTTTLNLPDNQSQLRIELPASQTGFAHAFAVIARAEGPRITIGMRTRQGSLEQRLVPFPPDALTYNGGVLKIDSVPESAEYVHAVLSLPAGTQVEWTQAGRVIGTATVPAEGVFALENGVAKSFASMTDYPMLFIGYSPKNAPTPAKFARTAAGLRVTNAGLADQLLRESVALPTSAQAPCCSLFVFEIDVDEQGIVRAARDMRRSGAIASASAAELAAFDSAVRRLRFRPLLVDGKASSFKALLNLKQTDTGAWTVAGL